MNSRNGLKAKNAIWKCATVIVEYTLSVCQLPETLQIHWQSSMVGFCIDKLRYRIYVCGDFKTWN